MPIIDLKSGYVLRALDRLPKQGTRLPYRLHQNYFRDITHVPQGADRGSGAARSASRAMPAADEPALAAA